MTTEARLPLIAGNWKMYKTAAEAGEFAAQLLERVGNVTDREVAVFPSFTALPAVAGVLRGSPIGYGGQNMHWERSGAYTGEVAAPFLTELACRYVLVGHSERRGLFGEDDAACGRKVRAAVSSGLEPVLCCGETLSEREAGQTFAVVDRQLAGALAGLETTAFAVAYEPVWAIGTGRTATPAQAEEVHRYIRDWLSGHLSPLAAGTVRILYGGSVKPDNVSELLKEPDVDGALVGGASLEIGPFCRIVNFVRR
jgi:triosephosphate isomerase